MKKIRTLMFSVILPEFRHRQKTRRLAETLSSQAPILYFSLLVNSLGLSATHIDVAPFMLVTTVPTWLFALCFLRMLWLWYGGRSRAVVLVRASGLIFHRFVVTFFVSLIFCLWACLLYRYGDLAQKLHTLTFIMSCVYCTAAITQEKRVIYFLSSIFLNEFFVFYYFKDRDEIFTTLAFCIALASLTCIAALYFYFHDYKTYRLSKLSLGVEIKRNRRLLSENFYLLNVDGLTGLPNRSYFFKSLTTFIADAKSAGLKLAVGMIDLNGFKAVNDLYGHGAGDAVLAELGSRLRKLNDQDVLIARLGGDEIGLVIGDASNNHTLQSTCEEIKEVFAKPFLLNNASAKISASIGFAMYPEAGNEANILLERADYAMYAAKKSGDHEVIFFSQSHQIDIQNKRKLHQALKDASLEDELQVFFQPIVHSETSKIVAFEALARWDSPVIGKVAPDRFIKAAEEINLIGKVTRVLFRKAVKAASLWPVEIELSFNLSAQDLMCGTIESELSGILKKYGFKPSRLILEVTETALLIDFEPAMKALQSLRESGIKIALDDFGTGYSSLGYIHKLPIDKIKIDKSFVKELGTNKKSQRILSSIILLSKNLELACVVEGIENEDQYQFLAHEGQLYLQGYRFGKPTPNPFSLLPTTAARPVVQTETAGL